MDVALRCGSFSEGSDRNVTSAEVCSSVAACTVVLHHVSLMRISPAVKRMDVFSYTSLVF